MKKTNFLAIALGALVLTASCSKDKGNVSPTGTTDASAKSSTTTGTGTAGSTARFAVAGDYLYTVDNSTLKTFNVKTASKPSFSGQTGVGAGIETIFARNNRLFIGSQSAMILYDCTNPSSPTRIRNIEHVVSKDPVIANDKFAFITLRAIGGDRTSRNQLQAFNISRIDDVSRVAAIPMEGPKGLAMDGDNLFVCDNSGLVMFDISSGTPVKKGVLPINGNDVLMIDGHLMVVGDDGFYQYNYDNDMNTEFLSKIGVNAAL